MYTSLCDGTNTRTLNWFDFLSALSAQLSGEKTNFPPPPNSPYNRLYHKMTCQLTECVAPRADWSVCEAQLLRGLTGHSAD